MIPKMKYFFLYAGCFFIVMGTVSATILNESFEIPEPNAPDWGDPPLNWTRIHNNPYGDCYAGLHDQFFPSPEYDRNQNEVDWSIPNPFHELQFVVLSTGDLGEQSDSEVTFATITQTVTFTAGQRFSGAFFFGTCDFLPYNDYGKIFLQPVDPNAGLPSEIVLAYSDVSIVGNYQSFEEWQTFEYDFTEQTAGTYILTCTVEDIQDAIYKSYLAVDGLNVCTTLYEYGDINMDCSVDLIDLDIMSKAWLAKCPDPNAIDGDPNTIPIRPGPPSYDGDPNYVPDPNCPCEIADINIDWVVDPNDLTILSTHWLEYNL